MGERMRQFWDKTAVSICLTLSLLLSICLGWMLHEVFMSGAIAQLSKSASEERVFIITHYEQNADKLRIQVAAKDAEIGRLTSIIAGNSKDAGKAAVSAANAAEAAVKATSDKAVNP